MAASAVLAVAGTGMGSAMGMDSVVVVTGAGMGFVIGTVIGAVMGVEAGVDAVAGDIGVAPMGEALELPLASGGAMGAAMAGAGAPPGVLATGLVELPPPQPAVMSDKARSRLKPSRSDMRHLGPKRRSASLGRLWRFSHRLSRKCRGPACR